jgi:hypothetical protein
MISVTNGEASLDEVSELLPSWKRHLRAALFNLRPPQCSPDCRT